MDWAGTALVGWYFFTAHANNLPPQENPGCACNGSRNLERLLLSAAGGWESLWSIDCWWMVLALGLQCIGGGVWGSSFSLKSCTPTFAEKGRSDRLDSYLVDWLWPVSYLLGLVDLNDEVANCCSCASSGFSLCLCELIEEMLVCAP